jgi:hypothetical protein
VVETPSTTSHDVGRPAAKRRSRRVVTPRMVAREKSAIAVVPWAS